MNNKLPGSAEAIELRTRIFDAIKAVEVAGPGPDSTTAEHGKFKEAMRLRNYEFQNDAMLTDDIDMLHAYERFLPDLAVISPKTIRLAVKALRKDGHEHASPVLTLRHINSVPEFDDAFHNLILSDIHEMFDRRTTNQYYPDLMNLRSVYLAAPESVQEFLLANMVRIGSTMTERRIMEYPALKSLVEQMYLAHERGVHPSIVEGFL
jgi:hypothetical protein